MLRKEQINSLEKYMLTTMGVSKAVCQCRCLSHQEGA